MKKKTGNQDNSSSRKARCSSSTVVFVLGEGNRSVFSDGSSQRRKGLRVFFASFLARDWDGCQSWWGDGVCEGCFIARIRRKADARENRMKSR